MSSAVVSTPSAHGHPFIFEDEAGSLSTGAIKKTLPAIRSDQSTIKNQQSKILPASVTPASRLAVRPAPEMVSSGIPPINALTGGLPRGCLTEIFGPASSGRTTVLLSAIGAATRRGEFCALVDAGDALDPYSAAAAGVELNRLLWVRCGKNPHPAGNHYANRYAELSHAEQSHAEQSLEQLLRATELLLESGGFGLIALDLADLPPQAARRIPMTTWFRFRRAVEHTPTVLLAFERQSIAGSCSSLLIKLDTARNQHIWKSAAQTNDKQILAATSAGIVQFPNLAHTQLLTELKITAEILRSRMNRKPARSAEIAFASKTAWAG